MHVGGISDEHTGAWFLQAAGSGIFFNTGRTISFDDHADGHLFFDAANVTVAAPRAHHVSRKPIRKAQAS